jgi:hypothetical protein
MTSTQFSRRVLRAHGTAIFVMTSLLMTIATIGVASGQGLYGFLQGSPWAYIGLVQAYWLMAVGGVSLWIGAAQEQPRLWHLVGALVHVVPIALNLSYYNLIASSSIGNSALFGLAFHSVFAVAEIVAGLNLVGHSKQARTVGH